MKRRHGRPGVALLEVIVATALLTLVISSWVGLFAQLRHSVESASVREAELLRAASLLSYSAVVPRDSLVRWTGGYRDGDLELRATPQVDGTFRITVRDTHRAQSILETVVRAPSTRAVSAP